MSNCISKPNIENNAQSSQISNIENNAQSSQISNIENNAQSSQISNIENNNKNLNINLDKYPPINYRKIKKSGFRVGAHVDIGIKDFEAGVTFGKNSIEEINFSENNNHLKLLKDFKNESENNLNEKDKIIKLMSKIIKDGSSSSEIVE